ncbi:hypothetical protein B0H19DRAFT_1077210 [Mycena capillaripes]|nr:hypothetical protein B0H19DRAFT_1077210 [Mycena capillaripes]
MSGQFLANSALLISDESLVITWRSISDALKSRKGLESRVLMRVSEPEIAYLLVKPANLLLILDGDMIQFSGEVRCFDQRFTGCHPSPQLFTGYNVQKSTEAVTASKLFTLPISLPMATRGHAASDSLWILVTRLMLQVSVSYGTNENPAGENSKPASLTSPEALASLRDLRTTNPALHATLADNRDRSHFRHPTTATVMIRQSTDVYDDNIPLAVVSDHLLSGGSSIADNFAVASVPPTRIVQFKGPRHPSPEPLVETLQYQLWDVATDPVVVLLWENQSGGISNNVTVVQESVVTDQGGVGFAVQDDIMFAASSCFTQGSNSGDTGTFDVAVRTGVNPTRVYLEARARDSTNRPITLETDLSPRTEPVDPSATYAIWSVRIPLDFSLFAVGAEIDGVKPQLLRFYKLSKPRPLEYREYHVKRGQWQKIRTQPALWGRNTIQYFEQLRPEWGLINYDVVADEVSVALITAEHEPMGTWWAGQGPAVFLAGRTT